MATDVGFNLRLTEAERDTIREAARLQNMSMQQFIHDTILESAAAAARRARVVAAFDDDFARWGGPGGLYERLAQ